MDSELSEKFEVKVGMHQGSVLSPFLFAVVIDVVAEIAIEGALSKLQYADDLVLTSETIEGLRNKFLKWHETFMSKGLKVNLEKPRLTFKRSNGDITRDGKSKVKVDPFLIFCLRVNANSVLYLQCGKWIRG